MSKKVNRRDFIKTGAAVGLTTTMSRNIRLFGQDDRKVRMGVIGLGVFIWLLAAVYRLIVKAKALDIPDTLKGMIIGFQAAFWGVIMHALTANSFIIIRIAEPFWFFTGLITVVYLNYNKNDMDEHRLPVAYTQPQVQV